MAKKSKKKEDETKKVVAKCDNPNEVVANCNNPEEVIANCENPQGTALSQYDIKIISYLCTQMVVTFEETYLEELYTQGKY